MSNAARGFPVFPGRREGSPGRRLDSWKEIASYLRRGERTVQRWAKERGLPVHRLHHAGGHTVYAYTDELDAWMRDRSSSAAQSEPTGPSEAVALDQDHPTPTARVGSRGWIAAAVLRVAAGVAAGIVIDRPPADPGPARVSPLTSDAGWERHPDLSPDGKQVAYAHHDRFLGRRVPFNLYVRLVDGGTPLQLTDAPHPSFSPKWSPDQKSIAFVRAPSLEFAEIRLISALGGDERLLFNTALPPFTPHSLYGDLLAWTPGGDALLHTDRSVERPGGGAIWSYDMASGRRTQVTRPGPHEIDFAPAVSPDGRTLAFARRQGLDDVRLYLVELSADRSAAVAETALPSTGSWNTSPVWTPNGDEIVFCAGDEPSFALWRIAASPDAVPRVLEASVPGLVQIAAAQSADSAAGVLVAETFDQSRDLLEIKASEDSLPPDASAGRPVIRSSGADSFGRYSPDGRRIAFVSDRTGASEIWVRDLAAERAVQWTSGVKPLPNAPAWSPDGSRLAFASSAAGTDDIWIVEGPGSAPVRLTTSDRSRELDPLWSHDGEWIYFASDRAGPSSTWRISAAGGEAESVGPRGFLPRWASPDGRWLYGQLFDGGPPPVVRVALDGSGATEELIEPGEVAGPATIRASGIYAVERLSRERLDHAVRRWPLEGGQGRLVAKLPASRPAPFDVSPDGERILWERDMGRGYDLTLIEAAY